jgi:hypothetical protein
VAFGFLFTHCRFCGVVHHLTAPNNALPDASQFCDFNPLMGLRTPHLTVRRTALPNTNLNKKQIVI